MYCLLCDTEMILELNWQNLFVLPSEQSLCNRCSEQLEIIEGKRCKICSRKSKEDICMDCKQWDKDPLFYDVLDFNYSIYTYNEQMSEIVAKWKYRGDYILATIFKVMFVHVFKEKFADILAESIVVPIPLSNERLGIRGFNQAKTLASFLPIKPTEILTRIHSEKQSKKTRYERISAANPFTINGKVNKPAILVDDIYTTGTTIRHAGSLLKKQGCPHVYSYTLIKS